MTFIPRPPTLPHHRGMLSWHLTQIQRHLGYEIPLPTQYIHPLPPTDPPFPPYDPWHAPAGDHPSHRDTDPAGVATGSF